MPLTDDERRVAAEAAARFPKGYADYFLVLGSGYGKRGFGWVDSALDELETDGSNLEFCAPDVAVAVHRGEVSPEGVFRATRDLDNFFRDRNCGYYHAWLSNSPDLCASILRSGPPPIGEPEELARC